MYRQIRDNVPKWTHQPGAMIMSDWLSVPSRFVPSSRPETKLLAALRRTVEGDRSLVDVSTASDADRVARADFLRWFLLEAIPASKLRIAHAIFEGFEIEGSLDLSGCKLALRPCFRKCQFRGPIRLVEANVPGLEFLGGRCPAIFADRVTVGGSLLVRAVEPAVRPFQPFLLGGAFRLNGATINGNLDMEGALLRGELQADGTRLAMEADGLSVLGNALLRNGFHTTGEVRLNGSRINRNLDCSGARLRNPKGYTLSAAGSRIQGSAYFGRRAGDAPDIEARPFVSQGALRLDGATIDGNLDCFGGRFIATAFLNREWSPEAGSARDIFAITAIGLVVGADIRLAEGFRASGSVNLINASAGKDLNCCKAWFDSPGGEALCADGMSIGGTAFFDDFRTNGVLRFVLAKFTQGFYIRTARFEVTVPQPDWLARTDLLVADFNGPACGVLARESVVSGVFMWKRVTRLSLPGHSYPFRLDLFGSRADVIDDDLESWICLTSFDVTDYEYRSISGLLEAQDRQNRPLDYYVRARTALLDCEYAILSGPPRLRRRDRKLGLLPYPCRSTSDRAPLQKAVDRFRPQPYLQFARVLRGSGLDALANGAMVHLERNRTRYGGYDIIRRAARYCLDVFLRYGYSTFRPVLILAGWSIVSSVVFQSAYLAGRFVPAGANVKSAGPSSTQQIPRIQFNAMIFAIDSLVPLVDLNQRKNWIIDPMSRYSNEQGDHKMPWYESVKPLWRTAPDRLPALLFIFNTFFGWLLTTLFAAGVSGFLRRGQG